MGVTLRVGLTGFAQAKR